MDSEPRQRSLESPFRSLASCALSNTLRDAPIGAQCQRLCEVMGDTQVEDRSSQLFRSSQPCWRGGRCDGGGSEMCCVCAVDGINTCLVSQWQGSSFLAIIWVGFLEKD